MTDAKNGNGKKSARERAVDAAYFGGTLVMLMTLHTLLVQPGLIEKARTVAREEMNLRMSLHEEQADERMRQLNRRLDELATREGFDALRTRLDSIDERLRHLERQGK